MHPAPPTFHAPPHAQRRWRAQMLAWLSEAIGRKVEREFVEGQRDRRMTNEAYCIYRARCGDLKPLRELYPQIADFIHLPKRKRGGQKKPPEMKFDIDITDMAIEFAGRIRELWKAQYHRQQGGPHPAEYFAVEICKEWWGAKAAGLTVDAVRK